jgi:site-specific recombinase XerD
LRREEAEGPIPGLSVISVLSVHFLFFTYASHWFTTHLWRAGMSQEFIQELRDVRKEAIDIYDHIDSKELRESYLAHIPQLGI